MNVTDQQIRTELEAYPEPWSIAEHFCDHEVAAGEYEGCSTELELAFHEYETRAKRILEEMTAP